jgi:hypothetical protein
MLSCDEAVRYLARSAEIDEQAVPELEAHLAVCASCRAALDEQRLVVDVLRARPAELVSPGFAFRLHQRLDETIGWFGLADWRAWTLRLTPVAVALALAALLTSGPATASSGLADWTMSGPDASSNASLLWQPDATPDSVLETMLGGPEAASTGEGGDVR